MSVVRNVVAAVVFLMFCAQSSWAQQNTLLPARAVPAGLQAQEIEGGGRILYGQMLGVKSARRALADGISRKMRTYFDSVNLQAAARTANDEQYDVAFSAKLRGLTVSGLAVSVRDASGPRFGFCFDDERRFARTNAVILHQLALAMHKVPALRSS
jgi:hypothetical protein